MVDYRFVVETLYKYRGSKSGKNWLCFIDEIEAIAPEERYVELRPYIDIIALKRYLVKNQKMLIHSNKIRKYIENSLRHYDEYYIGNIENILEIIELISEYENYDRIALLNELKRIFEVQKINIIDICFKSFLKIFLFQLFLKN